jgi:hypothetical protein
VIREEVYAEGCESSCEGVMDEVLLRDDTLHADNFED